MFLLLLKELIFDFFFNSVHNLKLTLLYSVFIKYTEFEMATMLENDHHLGNRIGYMHYGVLINVLLLRPLETKYANEYSPKHVLYENRRPF